MSVYAATLAPSLTVNRPGGLPEPVKIQASAAQSPLLQVVVFTIASVIWEDLMPFFNHNAANIRGLIKKK